MKTYYALDTYKKSNHKKDIVKELHPEAEIIELPPRNDWFYDNLKKGDTLIVHDIQSITETYMRSVFDFKFYFKLYEKGIKLFFDDTPEFNSNRVKKISKEYTGNLEDALIILLEASNERMNFFTAERRASMMLAKKDGKQIGGIRGNTLTTQKSKEAKEKILELSKDFNGTLSDKEVIKEVGIARNTYYKYKSQLRKQDKEKD